MDFPDHASQGEIIINVFLKTSMILDNIHNGPKVILEKTFFEM